MKIRRIAYITETSAEDRHAWSGTAHYVYAALREHGYEVTALGPARPGLLRYLLAFLNQASLKLSGKRFDYRHSTPYSKAFGRLFSKKIRQTNCEAVVVCGATEYGAYLDTDKPVYYVLDRTIAGALNYHSILSGLWSFSMQQSVGTDERAMKNAAGLLFSSQWAASHALKFYHVSEKKCHVLPFGANMDILPSREEAMRAKDMKVWNILMIATAWKNKGADIACRAISLLRKKGIPVRLTVVGSQPENESVPDFVHIIPFADKNTKEGMEQIAELYHQAHLFILPTRFDCTPIVFCEASAFGVPVLSANTGGVEGHVKEGVNGFLVDYTDQGQAYADKIESILSDGPAYERLRNSTRDLFEQKLNWKSWASAFEKIVDSPPA